NLDTDILIKLGKLPFNTHSSMGYIKDKTINVFGGVCDNRITMYKGFYKCTIYDDNYDIYYLADWIKLDISAYSLCHCCSVLRDNYLYHLGGQILHGCKQKYNIDLN